MFSLNMLQYIKLVRKYRIFQQKTEFFPKIKLTHKKQLKLKVAVENILLKKKKRSKQFKNHLRHYEVLIFTLLPLLV